MNVTLLPWIGWGQLGLIDSWETGKEKSLIIQFSSASGPQNTTTALDARADKISVFQAALPNMTPEWSSGSPFAWYPLLSKKVDFTSTWTKIYNNMQKMHHDLSPHEKLNLIQIISCYNCIQWCEIGWLLHALTDAVLCCPWMQKGNLQPSLLCKQTEEWLMS